MLDFVSREPALSGSHSLVVDGRGENHKRAPWLPGGAISQCDNGNGTVRRNRAGYSEGPR
jgi:hypothetical protein